MISACAARASRSSSGTSPSGRGASTSFGSGAGALRAARRSPRLGCAAAAARGVRRRCSSATRATSTCRRRGAPRAGGRSSSTRSSRSADTLVERSRPLPRRLARRRARSAASTAARFGAADLVVADTEAHAELPRRARRRPTASRSASSARRSASSSRGWRGAERFTCLFVGKLIPLHGLETILEAARLAPELRFRVVGSGQLERAARRPAAERRLDVPWLDYEQLPAELRAAGCALGIFGTSAKAARVIPNKAFQALACGTPLVTADTPAARELLVDGESALLVAAGRSRRARRRAARASPRDAELAQRLVGGRARDLRASARARRCSASAGARCSRALALSAPSAALWAAVAAYAAAFATLSILRDRAFQTGRFDLGNMVQAVWSTAHGHPLQRHRPATATRSRGSARTSTRSSSLFAPLWWIWPSPDLLLVAQADRDRARRAARLLARAQAPRLATRAALGFALAYLLLPAGAVADAERVPPGRACDAARSSSRSGTSTRTGSRPSRVFALLACVCKEEIPLVVAGFGIWYALARRRRRRRGGDRARAGVAWAALAIGVVIPHFNRGRVIERSTAATARSAARRRASLQTAVDASLARSCEGVRARAASHYLLDLAAAARGALGRSRPLALSPPCRSSRSTCSRRRRRRPRSTSTTRRRIIPPLVVAAVLGAARLAPRRRARRVARARGRARRRTTGSARSRSGASSRAARAPGARGARLRTRPHRGAARSSSIPAGVGRQRVELARRAPLRRAAASSASRTCRTRRGSPPTRRSPGYADRLAPLPYATRSSCGCAATRVAARLRAGRRARVPPRAAALDSGIGLAQQVRAEREREQLRGSSSSAAASGTAHTTYQTTRYGVASSSSAGRRARAARGRATPRAASHAYASRERDGEDASATRAARRAARGGAGSRSASRGSRSARAGRTRPASASRSATSRAPSTAAAVTAKPR